MLIFVHGADTFRSHQYLKEQIEKFKTARDPQGYNVVFFDGQKEILGKIIGEIGAVPFLAERRMIIINNILSNNDKEMLGEISNIIRNNKIPESNVVIFWQGEALSKVKEAKELEQILKKEKYAHEFAPLKGIKLNEWIKREVQKHGKKIDVVAVDYLAENSGGDIWLLSSLINQLASYISVPDKKKDDAGGEIENETIGINQVKLFLEEKVDDNIFNMVDAIISGNKKLAFKLIREQRRRGEEGGKLFNMIVWQMRILLEMRDLYDREDNIPSEAIAKKLSIHPFVARKNLYLIKRLPQFKIKQLHQQLLEIDLKTKTGHGDQSLLLDLFIARN